MKKKLLSALLAVETCFCLGLMETSGFFTLVGGIGAFFACRHLLTQPREGRVLTDVAVYMRASLIWMILSIVCTIVLLGRLDFESIWSPSETMEVVFLIILSLISFAAYSHFSKKYDQERPIKI